MQMYAIVCSSFSAANLQHTFKRNDFSRYIAVCSGKNMKYVVKFAIQW